MAFEHRCVISEGDLAGNKTLVLIGKYNANDNCPHCGEPLIADVKEAIAELMCFVDELSIDFDMLRDEI